jgi:RHS repeat-associated protein
VAQLNSAGAVETTFVYGTRSSIPDYLVQRSGSSLVTYRVIADHLGSPRMLVNTSTGVVSQQLAFDEFGRVLLDTNPGFQPFGFAGGLYDADTGLVRFGARDYDAFTGRWTARDPILFAGGQANLYAYVNSDPINAVDPSGLEGFTNAIGLYWGLLGWAKGGDAPTIRWHGADFVVEFHNHPLQAEARYSTTFGEVICYAGSPSPGTVEHELQHVEQFWVLGDLYLPVHVAAQAWSWALDRNYSSSNPLEMGPYSTPPQAWPW